MGEDDWDRLRYRLNIKQSCSGLMLLVSDLGSLNKSSTRRASNSWFIKRSNALNVDYNLH